MNSSNIFCVYEMHKNTSCGLVKNVVENQCLILTIEVTFGIISKLPARAERNAKA